jgi:2-polyprenyl-6-methoxyphenol hydroxylase-like FAD-dependent oxidoreductase
MVCVTETDVIVVGAGPVGLWLAAELRLGGVNVVVLEKRDRRSPHSRAFTLHARTLEVFASRGLADGWLAEGQRIPTTHYAMLSSRLDLSGLDSDFPFVLFIPQVRTEELLEDHATAVGAQILRGLEVTEVTAADSGVRVIARGADGPREFRAPYLAGCDGRRSMVRDAAGIGYEGTEDTITCVIGDVHVADGDVPPAMTLHSEAGSFYGVRLDATRHRLIGIEHATMTTAREVPLGFDEYRATIARLAGRDFGMHDPTWLTRVGSSTFQADRYRSGRIVLAGDAAHVHFPMGGQGLNLGLQDAMNLGWKLAAVTRSAAPAELLDSYAAERAPAGHAVIEDTLAQTAVVAAQGREGQALRAMLTGALATSHELNRQLATAASGVDVSYPPRAGGHPLTGRRVPNLRLTDGSDVFGRLAAGRFVLIGVSPAELAGHAGPDVQSSVLATADGFTGAPTPWDTLGAVLIRPDGHLAWAADRSADIGDHTVGQGARAAGAAAALRRWLPGPSHGQQVAGQRTGLGQRDQVAAGQRVGFDPEPVPGDPALELHREEAVVTAGDHADRPVRPGGEVAP